MPSRKGQNRGIPPDLAKVRAEDLPLFVTKVHLLFLQEYFSTCPDDCWPGRWVDDRQNTGIVITDQSPIGEDVVQRRPLIITQRGNMGMGNISMDTLLDEDILTGKRTHTDLCTGTMSLQCIAREGLEAQRLAWHVAKALRIHRRILMRWGIHNAGLNIQVGTESPAGSLVAGDSDSSWVTVPVFHELSIQDTYSVLPLDVVKLRSVEIEFNVMPAATDKVWGDMLPQEVAEESNKHRDPAFKVTVLSP